MMGLTDRGGATTTPRRIKRKQISGMQVLGNPTQYYRRPGSGHSLGGGIKVGNLRAEWASDSNAGRGTFFLHFGERF